PVEDVDPFDDGGGALPRHVDRVRGRRHARDRASARAARRTARDERRRRGETCHTRRPMREADDELQEIKREIIESRGLVIKTNNLTNALSADIKSIAKRQQAYERRLGWNSATAYAVFVIVVFTALKFAWDARVDYVTAETQQKTAENERLRRENRELEKREENAARAEA